MADFWHLHGIDWLEELSDAETARLLAASHACEHAPGATVFEPAKQPRSVFLLERGLVRIYRLSETGSEVTLGYVRPGELFGELGVLGQPRESFAQAVRASSLWRVPVAELQRILDEHPRIARHVTALIGSRFKRIESRVEDLVFRDLRSRLSHVLVELAEDFGRGQDGALVIDLELSQQDLARLVGATRQTVNLTLRQLREAGLIRYRNRRFVVPDLEGLRTAIPS